MRRVAVFGAGHVGTRLVEEIVARRLAAEVVLFNRSQRKLRGVVASLQMWARLINSPVEVSAGGDNTRIDFDLVVVAVKDAYDPRELVGDYSQPWVPVDLRYAGLARDLPLLREVADRIAHYSGLVLVLTNPVDLMTTYSHHRLKDARVLGGGVSLDSARLSVVLARQLGRSVDEFHLVMAGEHGLDVFVQPDYSTVQAQPVLELLGEEEIAKACTESAQFGFAVVRDLGYTVHDCGHAFAQDVQWLLERPGTIRSFSGFRRRASVGLPFAWRDGTLCCLSAGGDRASELLNRSEERTEAMLEQVARSWPHIVS